MQERFLEIAAAVDTEFNRNRRLHGERIKCRAGCSDCCHQLFRITEVEAAYIAEGLRGLASDQREEVKGRARLYMDRLHELAGHDDDVWRRARANGAKIACPALHEGVCSIYEHRPLMCHKFGMPLFNPDKPDRIFACELNFADGEEIVDNQLVTIQTTIHLGWRQLQIDYHEAGGYRDPEPITVARAILEDFPTTP